MNKYTPFLLAILMLSMVAMQATRAQFANEPAWRVVNPERGMLVPDYSKELNPFPWVAPPKKEEVTQVDYAAIEKAEARALLMRELRAIIKEKRAYAIDFMDVMPRGYLKGQGGAWIVMGGKWYSVGGEIELATIGTENVLQKLKSLKELDPEIAAEFENKVFKIMPKESTVRVKIINISSTYVQVKDNLGRLYKLNIQDNADF